MRYTLYIQFKYYYYSAQGRGEGLKLCNTNTQNTQDLQLQLIGCNALSSSLELKLKMIVALKWFTADRWVLLLLYTMPFKFPHLSLSHLGREVSIQLSEVHVRWHHIVEEPSKPFDLGLIICHRGPREINILYTHAHSDITLYYKLVIVFYM